jgi:hypothetical protein
MHAKSVLLTLLLSMATARLIAVEFSGYTIDADRVRFVLTDPDSKVSSGYMSVGQTFRGVTLVAFDREQEILTVSNDGNNVDLPLRKPRVKDAHELISGGQPSEAFRKFVQELSVMAAIEDGRLIVKQGAVAHVYRTGDVLDAKSGVKLCSVTFDSGEGVAVFQEKTGAFLSRKVGRQSRK